MTGSKIQSEDIQIFLAVAQLGTLSAAARAMGASQPTLGRRLARFEQSVGLVLFEKSQTGYRLTASGRKLMAAADGFVDAEVALLRHIEAAKTVARPTVRICAGEWMSKIIAGNLTKLQALAPQARILLETQPHVQELDIRANDIVIHEGPVGRNCFVMRRLGRTPYAAFGARQYVGAHPAAMTNARYKDCTWALVHRFAEEDGDAVSVAEWGYPAIDDKTTILQCTSGQIMLELVRDGHALGFMPTFIGQEHGLVQVSPEVPSLEHDYWLVFREEARRLPHISAITKQLAAVLSRKLMHNASTNAEELPLKKPAAARS